MIVISFGRRLQILTTAKCLCLLTLFSFDTAGYFPAGMKPIPWPSLVVRVQSFFIARWIKPFTDCYVICGAGHYLHLAIPIAIVQGNFPVEMSG